MATAPIEVLADEAEKLRVRVFDFHSFWLGFNLGRLGDIRALPEGKLRQAVRDTMGNAPKRRRTKEEMASAAQR